MLLMHVHIVMMGSCRVTGHLMMMMVRIVHQIGNGHTDGDGVTVAAAVIAVAVAFVVAMRRRSRRRLRSHLHHSVRFFYLREYLRTFSLVETLLVD